MSQVEITMYNSTAAQIVYHAFKKKYKSEGQAISKGPMPCQQCSQEADAIKKIRCIPQLGI